MHFYMHFLPLFEQKRTFICTFCPFLSKNPYPNCILLEMTAYCRARTLATVAKTTNRQQYFFTTFFPVGSIFFPLLPQELVTMDPLLSAVDTGQGVPIAKLLGARRAYCSHYRCRLSEVDILPTKMSRCAMCKEARYCSRECQKQHWPIHKGNCKQIAKLLNSCLEKGSTGCLQGEVNSIVRTNEQAGCTSITSCKEQLADMIFLEGYHSSDTMDRAATIYASAVSHYTDLRHQGCYRQPLLSATKTAIVLAALDRDDMAFTLLVDFYKLGKMPIQEESPCFQPGDWILPLINCSTALPEYLFHGHNEAPSFPDVVNYIILLLGKLRLISNGRIDLFAKTDAGAQLKPVVPTLSEFVRGNKTFLHQQRHDIDQLLASPGVKTAATKLRDCILLSTDVGEDERYREHLPDEFLHLIQDCYFLSPGVSDLLFEILPEEEQE